MSKSLNKVMLIGTIGKDPEIVSKNGFNIAKLVLATSENHKDKQTDQWVKNTEWHKLVLFGKLADSASSFVKKGSLVYVEGKLKTSKYTSKDGIERYSTDIMVSLLTLLDKKNEQGANYGNNESQGNYKPTHHNKKPSEPIHPDFDDEVPF